MGYTLHVTLTNSPGALVRLSLLLNQRGLMVEALSMAPGESGRHEAVIQIDGNAAQAGWAARQLTRMRTVEKVQVVGEGHHRQWTLMRVPTPGPSSDESWVRPGMKVLGRDGEDYLVEFSGHPEEVAQMADSLSGRVLSRVVCPGAVAAIERQRGSVYGRVTKNGKGRIGSGRTLMVRRGCRTGLAQ